MKPLTIKQFIEKMMKKNPFHAMSTMRDLIELEAIETRLNVTWGVELDIKVNPAPKQEGKFWGKSLIKAIEKEKI